MKIKELINSTLWIFYLLAIVYLIYQVLRAIFGGTWVTENIILGGIGIIITGVFTMVGFMYAQSNTLGRLEERSKHFDNKLINFENRFTLIENRLTSIENRLTVIERKI